MNVKDAREIVCELNDQYSEITRLRNLLLDVDSEATRLENMVREIAAALDDYGSHQESCIRCKFEGGEPTPDGGYRMKFAGKWYSARPSRELPKCDCGYDEALAKFKFPSAPGSAT